MVGASDGKFVIPLARSGRRVIAIERDHQAIHGGPADLPGKGAGEALGLLERLALEGLSDRVDVLDRDLFDVDPLPSCSAVWTSCSWHYSINHTRPLHDFIGRLRAICEPGGLLGAEYMMPVEPRHTTIEHYLDEGDIRDYLTGWEILWETYTPAFIEDAHIGQSAPHTHRMGFVIATRSSEARP